MAGRSKLQGPRPCRKNHAAKTATLFCLALNDYIRYGCHITSFIFKDLWIKARLNIQTYDYPRRFVQVIMMIKQILVLQEHYNWICIQLVVAPDADIPGLERILLVDLQRVVTKVCMAYVLEFIQKVASDPSGEMRMLTSKVPAE